MIVHPIARWMAPRNTVAIAFQTSSARCRPIPRKRDGVVPQHDRGAVPTRSESVEASANRA